MSDVCVGGRAINGCAVGDRRKAFDEEVPRDVVVWSIRVSVGGGCEISETKREVREEGPVWEIDLLCGVAIEFFISVFRVWVGNCLFGCRCRSGGGSVEVHRLGEGTRGEVTGGGGR